MKRAQFTRDQLGMFLISTPTEGGRLDRSMVNYHSGIPDLDEYLKDKKFADLNVEFKVELYNNAVLFILYQGEKLVWVFPLKRESIVDIKATHGLKLNIRKNSKVGGGTLEAIAGMGGIVGGIVAGTVDALTSKKGVPADQLTLGSVFEIVVKTDNEEQEKIIISSTDKYKDAIENILKKILEPKTEEKKGCYIATVCYNDIDAPQVEDFRRYRDNVLSKQLGGKLLIKFYYSVSPKISCYLKDKPRINHFIKKYLLDNIHYLIK